ncbi:MAG: hypothetical protein WA814_03680, partial [Candidatus Baltobacteraceae bacterium]
MATLWRFERSQADDTMRRLCAAVYALCGNDRELAGVVEPDLLACRTGAAAAAYLASLRGGAQSHDRLAAAGVLAWYADAAGVYATLREAFEA